ncbi:MAG: gliding motility protein GldN [Saprospiraceae bacterium]
MKTFHKIFSFVVVLILMTSSENFAQVEKPAAVAEEVKTESSTPTEDIFVDDIVRKRIVVENRLMPQQPIREGDISWEKRIQRVIDTREKMNLPFRSRELNLFTTFRTMIENGEITVFSYEDFKAVMTKEDMAKKMSKQDTLYDLNPDTYEEVIKIVQNEINWERIDQYRVKEVWYFDKQRSVMDVRILGIAPLYASDKDIENNITPYPLFWVYYPEARTALSKHRVFNEENDIAPMTWADLFDSRIFSSYIYKRSNVLDNRLVDYFEVDPEDTSNRTGIDRLLLSEKIKNELLNFEHDLWEY